MRPAAGVEALSAGIAAGARGALARAVTLVESRRPDHRAQAKALLADLLPRAGAARRVGVTGVPGVGKSTFIDSLGAMLVEAGHRVAVLAVDPSSGRTGGSILGDKTRMPRLAAHAAAFVRPSPAGRTLGGVARRTRETMLLCEAAGFDVVLVETVGVGQSETAVADMVDFFLVLALPGAGDALQGIKKGLVEIADAVAVTKADGDNARRAQEAARHYADALAIVGGSAASWWRPPVLTVSGLAGTGLPELWQVVERHGALARGNGAGAARREVQRERWLWSLIEAELLERFRHDPRVAAALPGTVAAVAAGSRAPGEAADALLDLFES